MARGGRATWRFLRSCCLLCLLWGEESEQRREEGEGEGEGGRGRGRERERGRRRRRTVGEICCAGMRRRTLRRRGALR